MRCVVPGCEKEAGVQIWVETISRVLCVEHYEKWSQRKKEES